MEAKVDTGAFEKALLKKLGSANIKKDEINAISASLKPLMSDGILFERWQWLGQPAIDTLVLTGRANVNQLTLLNRMTLENSIKEIILRKIGVVAIHQVEFEAHVALNQ